MVVLDILSTKVETQSPLLDPSIIPGSGRTKNVDHQKGMSVTRALVMLGFDDWKNLEPGKMICRVIWIHPYYMIKEYTPY